MAEERATVLVVGRGVGGIAAALAAVERGADVMLTEPLRLLGGQLTSQGVPRTSIPGSSGSAARFATAACATASARTTASTTSSRRPRAPAASSRPRVLLGHVAVRAEVDAHRIAAVAFRDRAGGGQLVVAADWVIDATETGDLLPLCGAEHVTGFESRAGTGEPHAPAQAQPLNMQPVSACFALKHRAGEDHTIERPESYAARKAERREGWPEGQLSFLAPDPRTRTPMARSLQPKPDGNPAEIGPDLGDPPRDKDLWLFRRVAARRNFTKGSHASESRS